MVMAAFAYMYDFNEMTFEIISFVVAIVISTSGAVWAYYSFSKVASEYNIGFTLMNQNEETVVRSDNFEENLTNI
jgi:hypothetical protein